MLKIAICDDEKSQINLLKNILSIHLDLKGLDYRIYEFDCGESLIDSITKESYDIIFSDIEMKAINGIDTAKNIRLHNKKSVIIFVTSYPDFVFQGYEVKAFNYILKPYTSEKIGKVLDSALEELNEIQDKFYVVESKSKTVKINLSNTYYFTSDKRKVNAVTFTETIDFYDKLDNLEKNLPSFFVRIHQRYLVNINHVSSVESSSLVINKEVLPISRGRYNSFMIEFAKTMLR
ncbi:LytR/AlgR family response regulator transcription factor [Paraclostridium sordellii]|uniref:Stage 0 sporulation protein A homolog n=1 Tax=Paraclostridium sordellii TaxID=1505 RepID=A0A9P1P8Y1_PARSO|nr:LytTR family DNA-binding domain-containing protein [Paeniclostridium sordellii]CEO32643.1 two-component response regulator [[Clostridium] sordellii] [Paeniclostridium sordellii]